MSGSANEKRPEWFHDALYKLDGLSQRWNERLTLHNLALSKRYIEGEVSLHIHFFRRLELEPKQFCAVFQGVLRVGSIEDHRVGGDIRKDMPDCRSQVDLDMSMGGPNSNQETMFVYDVQLMDEPQSIVPAFVWLGGLDEIHGNLTRALYFSRVLGFEVIGAAGKGEFGMPAWPSSIGQNHLPHQAIKSAGEIVKYVSDYRTPSGRRISVDPDADDALAGLVIALGEDFIWAGFKKPQDLRFEISDMLFGPFDLGPEGDRPIDHGDAVS